MKEIREFLLLVVFALLVGAGLYLGSSFPQVAESISDARIAEAQAQVSIELARAQQITALSGLLTTMLFGLLALALSFALMAGGYILLRESIERNRERERHIERLELEFARRASLPQAPVMLEPGATFTQAHASTQRAVFYDVRAIDAHDR